MAEIKIFKIPKCMAAQPCKECGIPVTTDDVLVQENITGGNYGIFCKKCFESLTGATPDLSHSR